MNRLDKIFRALAFVLLVIATQTGAADALSIPADDGWYRWTTPSQDVRACCYSWHNHKPVSNDRGCELDKTGGVSIRDCDATAEALAVYVRMLDGKPADIRAFAADCPVSAASNIHDLGDIAPLVSMRWLLSNATSVDRHTDDSLLAIALHRDDIAFIGLRELLEDRSQSDRLREQAMFWMVQSGSSQAFDYLDNLLSAR